MTTSPTLASPNILQAIYWSELDKMHMSETARADAKANIAGVAAIQDSFDQACSSINQNGDLSAQGRASALLAAGTRSLHALDALTGPTLAALDAQLVAASRALRQAASGPEATTVTELRAVESRAAFAAIDVLLRPMRYLELCQNGEDDAACIAVENAPGFAPALLNAETIEQGRRLRGARRLPDQDQALNLAQDLRAMLAAAVAAARRHMTIGRTNDPLVIAPIGAYAGGGNAPDEGV